MAAWDEVMTQVLNEHGASLYGYGRIVTGNQSEGEDLVHDAVVRVFSRMSNRQRNPKSGLSPNALPSTVAAYVRRAMLTIYIDNVRRKQRWRAIRFRAAASERAPDHADAITTRSAVSEALATLSPTQRACVVLYYYEDLTAAQVAAQLGLAHGTVKRHLHDALARLRTSDTALILTTTTPAIARENNHG